MPCVALTAGSLVFVALAVALIPSQIDGSKPTASLSSFDRPAAPQSTTFSAALARAPSMPEPAMRRVMTPQPVQVVERIDPPPAPPLPADVTPAPESPPDPTAPHREN